MNEEFVRYADAEVLLKRNNQRRNSSRSLQPWRLVMPLAIPSPIPAIPSNGDSISRIRVSIRRRTPQARMRNRRSLYLSRSTIGVQESQPFP
jgi:hypothetical protein